MFFFILTEKYTGTTWLLTHPLLAVKARQQWRDWLRGSLWRQKHQRFQTAFWRENTQQWCCLNLHMVCL